MSLQQSLAANRAMFAALSGGDKPTVPQMIQSPVLPQSAPDWGEVSDRNNAVSPLAVPEPTQADLSVHTLGIPAAARVLSPLSNAVDSPAPPVPDQHEFVPDSMRASMPSQRLLPQDMREV